MAAGPFNSCPQRVPQNPSSLTATFCQYFMAVLKVDLTYTSLSLTLYLSLCSPFYWYFINDVSFTPSFSPFPSLQYFIAVVTAT